MWGTTLFLLLAGLLVWFWLDSLRARERAIEISRNACQKLGLQLLDQTVSLARLRLARSEAGHVCLRRDYRFEYNSGGDERLSGVVTLRGQALDQLLMGPVAQYG
jgi:hypothetical protein